MADILNTSPRWIVLRCWLGKAAGHALTNLSPAALLQ